METKLDTRKTILVGMAFLSITAFWQMYNNVIPLILTNTFHMNETISGIIMAADNVLALFLLPLFGGPVRVPPWKTQAIYPVRNHSSCDPDAAASAAG